MILFFLYLTSPLVIYSILGIRLSRFFLLIIFFQKIFSGFKEDQNYLASKSLSNLFQNLFWVWFYYLFYLLLWTSFSYFLIPYDPIPSFKSILQDIIPRFEITFVFLIVSSLTLKGARLIISGFFLGWFINFYQAINLIFFLLGFKVSPYFLADFLIDSNKYPGLVLTDQYSLSYQLASNVDNFMGFIRLAGLIGEPSIFGVYSVLSLVILYFLPIHLFPRIIRKIPKIKTFLVSFSVLMCLMSVSKTSILLLIIFSLIIFTLEILPNQNLSYFNISPSRIICFSIIFSMAIIFIVNNSQYLSVPFTRLFSGSGHISHLKHNISMLSKGHFLHLIFGSGLGIFQSSHRFFLTQIREGGIFMGLIFSFCNFYILFIYFSSNISRYISGESKNRINLSGPIASIILLTSFLLYDPSCQPVLWFTFSAAVSLSSMSSLKPNSNQSI